MDSEQTAHEIAELRSSRGVDAVDPHERNAHIEARPTGKQLGVAADPGADDRLAAVLDRMRADVVAERGSPLPEFEELAVRVCGTRPLATVPAREADFVSLAILVRLDGTCA